MQKATHMKLLVNLNDPSDVTAHAVAATIKDGQVVTEEPAGDLTRQGEAITIENLFNRGPIQLGILYHTRNSPGCVVYIGNKKYELC